MWSQVGKLNWQQFSCTTHTLKLRSKSDWLRRTPALSEAKDARVLRQCMDWCRRGTTARPGAHSSSSRGDAFRFRAALKLLLFYAFVISLFILAHLSASSVWCFGCALWNPSHQQKHRHSRHILWGVMGSKLTRQRSLDFESKLSKRRRQRNDAAGEGERSGGGDFLFTSLMLRSDKLPGMLRKTNRSPYVRRVAWVREIQRLLREKKMEQAAEVLKLLRKVCIFDCVCTCFLVVLKTLLLKKETWNNCLFIDTNIFNS